MSLVLGLGREYARLLASRGAAVVGETDGRAGGVVRVLIIGLLVVILVAGVLFKNGQVCV